MLIIAALFIGYHVLLLYSDLTRPEPAGFVFGIHESAIVVRAVAPGSRAARAGLAVGDRVLTANSHPVRSRLDWSSGASWTHFRAARRLLWHRILRRNRCWMAARPPGPAASIDRQAGSHTVHIQFDDAVPVAQQWFDSVSSQELYAPDGVALARRLARARTMRFGFTPFNAAPVVAEFHMSGFDDLVGLVAGTCGWRVDEPRPRGKTPSRTQLNASPLVERRAPPRTVVGIA